MKNDLHLLVLWCMTVFRMLVSCYLICRGVVGGCSRLQCCVKLVAITGVEFQSNHKVFHVPIAGLTLLIYCCLSC
uniref:Uncharacterized protein n=1 Tax=Rhizophora mucronata TaxID=61149 RepID=A0A2P2JV12_RHIMU